MSGWQLAFQGGGLSLVLFVVYKLGRMLISNQGKSDAEKLKVYAAAEAERTATLRESLGEIVSSIREHSIADLQSHAQIGEAVARLEGKVDGVLDQRERFTPVHGVPIGEFDDGPTPTTDVQSPNAMRTKVAKPRGLYLHRGKTNGKDE